MSRCLFVHDWTRWEHDSHGYQRRVCVRCHKVAYRFIYSL
jgi:hypothetical protein